MFWKKKVKVVEEKRTILFVDDEEAILRSLERGLFDEPYDILFANSCKKALEILQQEEVHIVVTDIRMPEMDGLEFITILKEKYPHIIRMVLSGYSKAAELQKAVEQGDIFKIIPKPWKLRGNFENLIRQAIEQYNLQNEDNAVKQ